MVNDFLKIYEILILFLSIIHEKWSCKDSVSVSYTHLDVYKRQALLHPTSFNLANSLRASGDVRFTMYVGIGSMLLFRLGSALLFGVILQMGVIGVWIAMGADWTARSAAFVLRYRSGKWKQFNAIK